MIMVLEGAQDVTRRLLGVLTHAVIRLIIKLGV